MDHSRSCMVILSGGQDSTTTLFWAKQHFDEVHAVTFDYGQKHHREIECAQIVADMAGVASHEIAHVGNILSGRSPLTNPTESLEQYNNYEEMDDIIGERVELTFVPMRNALFITLAANRAICKDIRNLVTGVCQADNANYPDCRAMFISASEVYASMALGLDKANMGPLFKIHTPLMMLSKAESIQLAQTIPGAFEALAYTHTAYDGQYPPIGHDHATILRAHGFEEAGVPDPLVVRAYQEGLMDLPVTSNYDSIRSMAMSRMVP